jgi:hypothetical protein
MGLVYANIELVNAGDIFFAQKGTTNAVVLPGADKILLGVIPIEDMDVDAKQEKLIVNPETLKNHD